MYFTIKGRIDYFIIVDKEKNKVRKTARAFMLLLKLEKKLFIELKEDYKVIKNNIKEQANIVHDFKDFRLERVP
jgi:hypothetical protein